MSGLTNEQKIANVKRWQEAGWVHPLTCGKDSSHPDLVPVERDGNVILICEGCDYVQSGIPEVCLFGPPPNPFGPGGPFGTDKPWQEEKTMDKLEELFSMQEQLNNTTFTKSGIGRPEGDGPLTISRIQKDVLDQKFGPNDLPNIWLMRYLTADDAESKELREDLLWKFWSKDKIDIQNIRVEIIDKLHFLISLAQVAGLSAEDFYRLYKAKHEVNNARQNNGYSKATKTEDDNKTIV